MARLGSASPGDFPLPWTSRSAVWALELRRPWGWTDGPMERCFDELTKKDYTDNHKTIRRLYTAMWSELAQIEWSWDWTQDFHKWHNTGLWPARQAASLLEGFSRARRCDEVIFQEAIILASSEKRWIHAKAFDCSMTCTIQYHTFCHLHAMFGVPIFLHTNLSCPGQQADHGQDG